jgi:hypothetical protein
MGLFVSIHTEQNAKKLNFHLLILVLPQVLHWPNFYKDLAKFIKEKIQKISFGYNFLSHCSIPLFKHFIKYET